MRPVQRRFRDGLLAHIRDRGRRRRFVDRRRNPGRPRATEHVLGRPRLGLLQSGHLPALPRLERLRRRYPGALVTSSRFHGVTRHDRGVSLERPPGRSGRDGARHRLRGRRPILPTRGRGVLPDHPGPRMPRRQRHRIGGRAQRWNVVDARPGVEMARRRERLHVLDDPVPIGSLAVPGDDRHPRWEWRSRQQLRGLEHRGTARLPLVPWDLTDPGGDRRGHRSSGSMGVPESPEEVRRGLGVPQTNTTWHQVMDASGLGLFDSGAVEPAVPTRRASSPRRPIASSIRRPVPVPASPCPFVWFPRKV